MISHVSISILPLHLHAENVKALKNFICRVVLLSRCGWSE